MTRYILDKIQVLCFNALVYLLKKICPTLFIFGRTTLGKSLSIGNGNKFQFVLSLTEIFTKNEEVDSVFQEALRLARLRASGVSDEKIVQLIGDFTKK